MKKKQLIKAGEVITFKRKKYLIQKISLDGELLFCTKEFGDLASVCLKRNEIEKQYNLISNCGGFNCSHQQEH